MKKRTIALAALCLVLVAATVTGATLTATVDITDTGGAGQTNVAAPWPMSTAGLMDAGILATSTLNVQLCEIGSSCPSSSEAPFSPSPSRTRVLSAQHYATTTSTWSDETADANDAGASDVDLVSASPAVDDAFYFLGDHPWRVLWLDIGTAGARGTALWTFAWEYYNGSVYTALPNVFDATGAFANTGTSTVSWAIPSDMSATSVNGVTGYPVRARITAAGSGTITQPRATRAWYEPGMWWSFNDSVPALGVESYSLFMGGPAIRTHHDTFIGNSGLTTADHADLELGNDFEVMVDGWVDTSAGTGKRLAYKQDAFELRVSPSTAGTIEAQLTQPAGPRTVRPNGAGDYTNIVYAVGCSNHWECVDEASPDDDSSYLRNDTGNLQKDAFALTDPGLLASSTINSVTVHFRFRAASGAAYAQPFLRLGSNETTGTQVSQSTAYADFSEALARPGGGSWTAADLDSLQAVMGIKQWTGDPRLTQVYVVVDYTSPTLTATATGVATGEHRVSAAASGGTLTLTVDSNSTTAAISTNSVQDNANPWEFLAGGSSIYMASTTIAVSGAPVLHWQIDRAEDALTISDRTGTAQDATRSFPALSSTLAGGVGAFGTTAAAAALSSQQPVGVAFGVASTTAFAADTSIGSGLPGGAFLASVASQGNVPVAFFWIVLAAGVIILTVMLTLVVVKNILYAVIAGGVVMLMFATPAVGVFPIWGVFMYAVMGALPVIIGRRLGLSA